jgi:hypothetical protein
MLKLLIVLANNTANCRPATSVQTNVGPVLVSMNPMKPLEIYEEEAIERYKTAQVNELHVGCSTRVR